MYVCFLNFHVPVNYMFPSQARDVDEFIYNHDDMLVLFAAGNGVSRFFCFHFALYI